MENGVRKESRFSHSSTDCLQITLLWLYKDLMKNLFLTVQPPLVYCKTRVTHLEGGMD